MRAGHEMPQGLQLKPHKAEELALDAHILGKQRAAKKHRVAERTVERANQQVREDPVLSECVGNKKRQMAEALHGKRVQFLEKAIAQLEQRIPVMEDRDLVGAYKIIADHHEVALGVMQDGGQPDVRPEPDSSAQEMAPAKPSWPVVDYGASARPQ